MKKLIITLLIFGLITTNYAFAKNVKVESLTDFSTANPTESMSIRFMNNLTVKDIIEIPANSIAQCTIIKVKKPKRLKQNATFTLKVDKIVSPESDLEKEPEHYIIGKYSKLTEITPKDIIKKGVIATGSKVVGAYLAPELALVKGMVLNEEGNRFKSAVVSAYDSTPLSLTRKGKDVVITEGSRFIVNFKIKQNKADVNRETQDELPSQAEESDSTHNEDIDLNSTRAL